MHAVHDAVADNVVYGGRTMSMSCVAHLSRVFKLDDIVVLV